MNLVNFVWQTKVYLQSGQKSCAGQLCASSVFGSSSAVLICLLDIQVLAADVQYITYLFGLFAVCQKHRCS